jgi:hypothetical protein
MDTEGGETWRWVRDESGRFSELSSTAGVKRSYAWAADGRLSQVATQAGGVSLSTHGYGYDGFGRRQAVTDVVGGTGFPWQYVHDGRDMLTSASYQGATSSVPYLSWRFDAVGTLQTSTGQRAVVDFVTNVAGGKGVVETKTGAGRLTSGQQQLFDDIQQGRQVIPRGQNALGAGLRPGEPTTLQSCGIDRPCP